MAVAGSLDPSSLSEASSRQVSEGAEVRLAPGYAEGTQLDLALIRLKRPFKWRSGFVEPVCLPSVNTRPSNQTGKTQDFTVWHLFDDRILCHSANGVDQLGTVAGWGWNDEEGVNMSSRLHRVQVPLMSRAECEKRFLTAGYSVPIDKTKVCAGWPQGGRDACQVYPLDSLRTLRN